MRKEIILTEDEWQAVCDDRAELAELREIMKQEQEPEDTFDKISTAESKAPQTLGNGVK